MCLEPHQKVHRACDKIVNDAPGAERLAIFSLKNVNKFLENI